MRLSSWPQTAPVVRTSLGRIHRQGLIWQKARHSPINAATQLLFRPRLWVREIGDCVMRTAGVEPGRFVSIHIRHSVEKLAEGKRMGAKLPALQAYHPLATALAADADTRSIFLQTASPAGLDDFTTYASSQQLGVFYTNNSRSEHDAWGGWSIGQEMTQSTVAAVNAYISSLAAVTASPGISLWTHFLHRTLPRSAEHSKQISVRCRPSMTQTSWFSVFGPRAARRMPSLEGACSVNETTCSEAAPCW